MKQCPYCYTVVQDEVQVCENCGAALPEVSEAPAPMPSPFIQSEEPASYGWEQPAPPPKSQKPLIILLAGLVVALLIAFGVVLVLLLRARADIDAMEPLPTATPAPTPEPIVSAQEVYGFTLDALDVLPNRIYTTSECYQVVVDTESSSLRMRSRPEASEESVILASLPKGTSAIVVADSPNDLIWVVILCDGQVGWVDANYLRKVSAG